MQLTDGPSSYAFKGTKKLLQDYITFLTQTLPPSAQQISLVGSRVERGFSLMCFNKSGNPYIDCRHDHPANSKEWDSTGFRLLVHEHVFVGHSDHVQAMNLSCYLPCNHAQIGY